MTGYRLLAMVVLTLGAAQCLQAAPSVAVSAAREMADTSTIRVNGVVRSRSDVVLSAEMDGKLTFVIEEGANVRSGALLARVDTHQLELQLKEQRLLTERAQIDVEYLNGEVERLLKLEQLTSKTQLAQIVSRRDLAANDLDVARIRVAQLNEDIARTRLTSPIDGEVVERIRQGGEFVRRGEPVVRVVNSHDLEVRASVPVSVFSRVQKTSNVRVRVSGIEFESTVRSAIGNGEETSQTFNVLIDVPESVAKLVVPGQLTDVSLPLTAAGRDLFVPRDAIVLRDGGKYVFTVDEQNRAKRVGVDVGAGRGDLVAVSGNLEDGDQVVVRGMERLEEGAVVVLTQGG